MKLIIGGAYQGKLDYALKRYDCGNSVYRGVETESEIDFSRKIVTDLHRTILAQLRSDVEPVAYFETHLVRLTSSVMICDDISCGVVPVDEEMRHWREEVGRVLLFLAENADEVIRVFCGLGTKLK